MPSIRQAVCDSSTHGATQAAEQCEWIREHPQLFSATCERVLFGSVWASAVFYPINDINYGVIASVACNNSPLF